MRTLFLFIILPFIGFTQESDIPELEDGSFGYREVIEFPSLTGPELHELTTIFLQEYHSDSEFLVNTSDKIIDSGSFPVTVKISMNIPMTYSVNYSLTTELKDGRMRATISDFVISQNQAGTTQEIPLENWVENIEGMNRGKKKLNEMKNNLLEQVKLNSERIMNELKGLNKPSEDNNW